MNKVGHMNIRQLFSEHISSSAFKKFDGELRVVGKYGYISILDNKVFDIYFGADNPLSEKKLSFILKNIPQELGYTRLNGEAYTQTKDFETVLKLLPLCKVKRKRKLSNATKKILIQRIRLVA